MPSADIAAAATLAGVDVAVIAVTGGTRNVRARVPAIRRLLAPTVDLWVGGNGLAAADQPNSRSRRLVRLATLEAFERQLAMMDR